MANIQSSFMQTPAWERMQQRLNSRTYWLDGVLFVNKKIRFGQDFWYAPRTDIIPELARLDAVFGKKTTFLKIEPVSEILPKPFVKVATTQPRQTLILNIDKKMEDVLGSMKSKTRYNIRLSERKGLKTITYKYPESLQHLQTFIKLTHETNIRDQIKSYDVRYYKTLLTELGKEDMAELLITYSEGEPLSAMILVHYNETSTYLFGASSSQKKELMASHHMQYVAIQNAIDRGSKRYDFWGVRVDTKFTLKESKSHISIEDVLPTPGNTYGVTKFKLGFGGSIYQYPPAYTRSYKPFWYNVYRSYRFFSTSKGFNF